MAYLVGTDEAGYGPNLGPLVISATVWEAPEGVGVEQLFDRLDRIITTQPSRVSDNGGPCVAMADSKKLYSPGQGLRHLERGLWAVLGMLGHRPKSCLDVLRVLSPRAVERLASIPWYSDFDAPAPLDCNGDRTDLLADRLEAGLAAAGVRLTAMHSRVIFEEEFNELVDRHITKGAALSHETLALTARAVAPLPNGPISVVCDKHGGRNRYGPLLSRHFPDGLMEIYGEGRERSVYRFGPADRRMEFCFRTKAESCLPAALASMASKYLRELAMRALNLFWSRRVPGIRPTAGYPLDAKRFRIDIAKEVLCMKISEREFWRMR